MVRECCGNPHSDSATVRTGGGVLLVAGNQSWVTSARCSHSHLAPLRLVSLHPVLRARSRQRPPPSPFALSSQSRNRHWPIPPCFGWVGRRLPRRYHRSGYHGTPFGGSRRRKATSPCLYCNDVR